MLRLKEPTNDGYFYKAATKTYATPKLYLSKGMAEASRPAHARNAWEAVEVKLEIKPSGCPNKIDGVCQMHNLQCGYPKCVE